MIVSIAFIERWAFSLALAPLGKRDLMFLGLGEAFVTHFSFSLYLGFFLALPVVAYQIWAFVAPGLYPAERRAALKLAIASSVLFTLGVLFAHFFLMPAIVEFFLSFEEPGLKYGGAIGPYLRLFAGVLAGSGLSFQLPLLLLALIKSGLLSAEQLSDKRRYWILGIVVAAAFLTPTGDLVTQSLLAFPMWLLFEGALLYARFTAPDKRNRIE